MEIVSKKAFIDTSPFIYYLNEDGAYAEKMERLFAEIDVIRVDTEIAKKAASLRAEHKGLKTAYAIQEKQPASEEAEHNTLQGEETI